MLLVIGNKRFSSWSLRPWLVLKHFQIPFEEKLIALDQPDTTAQILKFSPSARVPALIDGEIRIWESLAIAEYLNERFPEKKMWPKGVAERARARAVANEMHGGFQDLRHHLPHDLQRTGPFDWSPAKADILRVQKLWNECLTLSHGPFLFGDFCIADAMFAPVVNRFVNYEVPSEGLAAEYIETMRNHPPHREWIDAGVREELKMPRYEKID